MGGVKNWWIEQQNEEALEKEERQRQLEESQIELVELLKNQTNKQKPSKIMIDRLYYTVEQLAEYWQVSIDDIIHLGLTDKLKFIVLADIENLSRSQFSELGEVEEIDRHELSIIYYSKEDFIIPDNDPRVSILKRITGCKIRLNYHHGISRLAVYTKEVERFENENISRLGHIEDNTKGNNKQVLTPKIKEHEKRNNDYLAYLKETIPHIDGKPEPYTFNFRRDDLKGELMKRNRSLWSANFDEWNNKHRPYKDIVKLKRGR